MSSFDKWWKKHNIVKETLMCEDARYVYESRQAEIDALQKRIDRAVEHIEDYYGVVELSMIVDILKGEET